MRLLLVIASSFYLVWASASLAGNPSANGAFIQIVSTAPNLGTPLRAGEKVRLTVEAEYVCPEESAVVGLVVQAADNTPIAQDNDVVLKGTGKVTLTTEFVVPATKMLNVFTPLSAQGQNSTSTVDSRAFKVIQK